MSVALISLLSAHAAPIVAHVTLSQSGLSHRYVLDNTVIDLELGEQIPGAIAEVEFDRSRADHVVVEMRYETSISVSLGGGGHWDLTDFAHHRSPWLTAEQTPQGLTLPAIDAAPEARFPAVSSAQIDDAIREHLGDDAGDTEPLPTCAGPGDGACQVSISTVWLKVTAFRDGEAVESRMVEMGVPMGC